MYLLIPLKLNSKRQHRALTLIQNHDLLSLLQARVFTCKLMTTLSFWHHYVIIFNSRCSSKNGVNTFSESMSWNSQKLQFHQIRPVMHQNSDYFPELTSNNNILFHPTESLWTLLKLSFWKLFLLFTRILLENLVFSECFNRNF